MSQFEGYQAGRTLLLEGGPGFSFYQPSTNWVKPTHIRASKLQSTYFSVNRIKKHPHRHTRSNLTKRLGTPWPSQIDTKLIITDNFSVRG